MAGIIKAIDHQTVHRICSGQVVLSLAVAVKELIENSLDAEASVIEVRVKEYGSELIEVVDNGIGIEENNFEGIALKHHTSKLSDFSDLVNVETYGFRGEALSSLCALGNLQITTCHKNSENGFSLKFNHSGILIEKTPCARQVGTTVSVRNLFVGLPVRHKEFLHNLKREFGKMIHMLTAYCLVCQNVRITCINQVGGKRTSVLTTQGSYSIRENIISVYGSKQISSLLDLEQISPTEHIQEEYNLSQQDSQDIPFQISGYISSCEHGKGRSAADRQFFFINDRPCDLPKVSRLVNEVYHTFNRHQNPFVLLKISLKKDAVDVNVTPDKRQIFIHYEKLLLATLKASLLQLFEPLPAVTKRNIFNDTKCEGTLLSSLESRSRKRKLSEDANHNKNLGDGDDHKKSLEVQEQGREFNEKVHQDEPRNETFYSVASKQGFERTKLKAAKNFASSSKHVQTSTANPLAKLLQFQRNSESEFQIKVSKTNRNRELPSIKQFCISTKVDSDAKLEEATIEQIENVTAEAGDDHAVEALCGEEFDKRLSVQREDEADIEKMPDVRCTSLCKDLGADEEMQIQSKELMDELNVQEDEVDITFSDESENEDTDCSSFLVDEPSGSQSKSTAVVQFCIEDLKQQKTCEGNERLENERKHHLFRAKINPSENKSAEDELRTELR